MPRVALCLMQLGGSDLLHGRGDLLGALNGYDPIFYLFERSHTNFEF